MTIDNRTAYLETTYRLPDASVVTVEAVRGTQYVSPETLQPLSLTKFGTVAITIRDATGGTATLVLDSKDDVSQIRAALATAQNIADSRDVAADRPSNN